jgi:rubrerythrin
MALQFNADEIFSIAERIEENGARFYRRAAERLMEPDVSNLLTDLAASEDEHKRIFTAMRDKLRKCGGLPPVEPPDSSEGFLNAWADGHIFRKFDDPLEKLTGDESVEDILRIAIDIEKDSVLFYLGMKETLNEESDKSTIERIIREEMDHYAAFSKRLAMLSAELN